MEKGLARLEVSHKPPTALRGVEGTTATATCNVSGLWTMDLQFLRQHESMGYVQTSLSVTPGAKDAPEATTGTSKHTICSHLHPPAPQKDLHTNDLPGHSSQQQCQRNHHRAEPKAHLVIP